MKWSMFGLGVVLTAFALHDPGTGAAGVGAACAFLVACMIHGHEVN